MRDGVLVKYSLQRIRRAARSVQYLLAVDGDWIILPAEKKEIRGLLQFLGEDIYRGAISRGRLLANGHRTI